MKHPLSDRINSLPVSQTLAMAAKARELKAAGKDIISLSLGEPDFNTPDFIKDAAIEAVNQNYNSYTPVDGYAELKEAICTKFKRDNGLTYQPNQIVVSTGAKQSIANIAQVLLNPGDEVLLPAPYWVSYSAIAILSEAKFVEIPSSIDNDFKITPAQLEAAITAVLAPISKIKYMVDEFKTRRDIVVGLLREIDGFKVNVPEGAFYVFPDISAFFGKTIDGITIENANDFSLFILEKANVATVTGDAFGAPKCIRMSYAASELQLREAIKRIAKALS